MIAWPENEEELVELVRIARQRKLPVVPFGAGSGVCGGTWAVRGGICIDLKRLERIEPVDRERRCVDVGAGVIGEVLERRLNSQGFTLGHFPSSIYMSTLGGWLATRSAGQLSSRYGKIEDMVLSLRAVTGRAELVVTPERPFAGPDLAQLLMGSEGTLCVFSGARLRVHPSPEHRTFRGLRFGSVAEGVEALRRIFAEGLRPAVARLYDPLDTQLFQRGKHGKAVAPSLRGLLSGELRPVALHKVGSWAAGHARLIQRFTKLMGDCLLVLLFEGERGRSVREDQRAAELCKELGAVDLGEAPGRKWLQTRYDVSYKLSPLMDAGLLADTFEVAVTWDKVLEVYEKVREAASPHALVLCHFSHAYAQGCSLYFSFVLPIDELKQAESQYAELWRKALHAASMAGASVSHHHGVGLLKAKELSEQLGEGRRLLALLKRTFDPEGIMNPGKLEP